jgi:G:T/U-mismatch repair DNA glycosylase
MNKTLYYYYIVCTCIRDVKFPNTEFHIGDVLYYNNNAASNEMWIFNNKAFSNKDNLYLIEADENVQRYKGLCNKSHIPLTRKKKNARLYKKLSQAEWIKTIIENRNDFKCEIKNIEVTYEYEK